MHAPLPRIHCRNMLGEGPAWCPEEQALWWIDVHEPSLWKWDFASGATRRWPLPRPPGTFALLEGGGLLLLFRSRIAVFDPGSAALRWLALPGLSLGEERFNDGKVDRQGRLWVGTLDRALTRPLGQLRRAGPSLDFDVVDSGFALSNGIAWSPDSRAMYFAETHERRIYRYDFDPLSGEASNRTVLVQLPDGPGGPDGLTVDGEGFLWCAMFERGCIERYRPTGELERRVELPVSRPTSCTIGGPDMKTLFITTARYGLSEQDLEREPYAGDVICLALDKPGIVERRLSLDTAGLVTDSERSPATSLQESSP